MVSLFKNIQNLVPKFLTLANGVITVFMQPFSLLWTDLVAILPTWAEFILTPIAWLINTLLPNNGSLLDLMFIYMIPFYIVWTVAKYFTNN